MKIDQREESSLDSSVKYRFLTDDGHAVEGLYFLYNGGLQVLCLSSQVGCDMGCKFCGTGLIPKTRNLSKEEIVEQARLIVADRMGDTEPDAITLAGMGEPLANYDACLAALEAFREIYGEIRLSLSTVGLTAQIRKMTKEERTFGLYVSLHGADDATRQKIMPAAKGHKIEDLVAAAEAYAEANDPGKVRISYLLLEGVTDTDEQMEKLIALLEGKPFTVQLRLWNAVPGIEFERIAPEVAERWAERLNAAGIKTVIRPSAGQDISAGCGQMARRVDHRVVPIASIADAEPYWDEVDDATAVLFDVDEVLSLPEPPALHPAVFKRYRSVVDELAGHLSKEQRHVLNHVIIGQPSIAVEEGTADVITRLQERKTPVYAFTAACPGGIVDPEEAFHEVRHARLKDLGIDFSASGSKHLEFRHLKPTKGAHPALKDGILYGCCLDNKKGDVLKAFLEEHPEIRKIIYVEDKEKHLQSVQETLEKYFPHIALLGLHYGGIHQVPRPEVEESHFREFVAALVGDVERSYA